MRVNEIAEEIGKCSKTGPEGPEIAFVGVCDLARVVRCLCLCCVFDDVLFNYKIESSADSLTQSDKHQSLSEKFPPYFPITPSIHRVSVFGFVFLWFG